MLLLSVQLLWCQHPQLLISTDPKAPAGLCPQVC